MNERDAQELIRMVEANWHFDLGPAREMWRNDLMVYNAEIATLALSELARRQPLKVNLADLIEAIHAVEERGRRQAAEDRRKEEDAKALAEGRRGYACPEWAHVWSWDRNRTVARWEKDRVPYKDRNFRGFPQQEDWTDPSTVLSKEEYEALREEWLAAGSPKEKVRELVETP